MGELSLCVARGEGLAAGGRQSLTAQLDPRRGTKGNRILIRTRAEERAVLSDFETLSGNQAIGTRKLQTPS